MSDMIVKKANDYIKAIFEKILENKALGRQHHKFLYESISEELQGSEEEKKELKETIESYSKKIEDKLKAIEEIEKGEKTDGINENIIQQKTRLEELQARCSEISKNGQSKSLENAITNLRFALGAFSVKEKLKEETAITGKNNSGRDAA